MAERAQSIETTIGDEGMPGRGARTGLRAGLGALALAVALVSAWGPIAPAGAAEPVAVDVNNRSVKTKCAEEDNVYYTLSAEKISGFRVEARTPAYVGDGLLRDSTAPDFSGCTFGHDPVAVQAKPYIPPTAVLYEDDQFILKGIVYPDFWRPTVVPVKVGNLTQNFLHLVQLWRKTAGGPIEFLVFYPQDGYWRLKGLPPFQMHEVSYGSSFLIGPVEESTRPFVAYKSVEFDPKTLTFTIAFEKGGVAKARVSALEVGRAAVDVRFEGGIDGKLPFAGLRSMYVTPEHADTAETVWRAAPGAPEQKETVVDFKNAKAAEVGFARSVPSTHNTSSPDILFKAFVRD